MVKTDIYIRIIISNASAYSDGAASASSHSSSSSEEDEVLKKLDMTMKQLKIYRLLNLIRFGPDNPTISRKRSKTCHLIFTWFVLMCRCTSLANKMDLFLKYSTRSESTLMILGLI